MINPKSSSMLSKAGSSSTGRLFRPSLANYTVLLSFISFIGLIRYDAIAFAQWTSHSFGCHQLEMLLTDRPDLREIIASNHEIARWLIKRFEPSDFRRIYWDSREPTNGEPVDCIPGIGLGPSILRVTANTSCVSSEKFASLVYMIFRHEYMPRYFALTRQAKARELSRDDFVREYLNVTFQSLLNTRRFLGHYDLLPTDSRRLKFLNELTNLPDDLDGYLTADAKQGIRKYYDIMSPEPLEVDSPWQDDSHQDDAKLWKSDHGPSLNSQIDVAALLRSSSEAKRFGQRQLEILLNDRPELRSIVSSDDTIAQWLVAQFQTKDDKIFWDHREPPDAVAAALNLPRDPYPATLRISSDTIPQLEKFANIVYQFYILENNGDFIRLKRSATAGELNREEFALAMMKVRLRLMIRTKTFLNENALLPENSHITGLVSKLIVMSDEVTEYDRLVKARKNGEFDEMDKLAFADAERIYDNAAAKARQHRAKPQPQ